MVSKHVELVSEPDQMVHRTVNKLRNVNAFSCFTQIILNVIKVLFMFVKISIKPPNQLDRGLFISGMKKIEKFPKNSWRLAENYRRRKKQDGFVSKFLQNYSINLYLKFVLKIGKSLAERSTL